MLELLHDDVLAFEHLDSDHVEDDTGLAHKTTVGLMERDCIVTNVLIGAPAEELLQVMVVLFECNATPLRSGLGALCGASCAVPVSVPML